MEPVFGIEITGYSRYVSQHLCPRREIKIIKKLRALPGGCNFVEFAMILCVKLLGQPSEILILQSAQIFWPCVMPIPPRNAFVLARVGRASRFYQERERLDGHAQSKERHFLDEGRLFDLERWSLVPDTFRFDERSIGRP